MGEEAHGNIGASEHGRMGAWAHGHMGKIGALPGSDPYAPTNLCAYALFGPVIFHS
jgi:hypothetical protein